MVNNRVFMFHIKFLGVKPFLNFRLVPMSRSLFSKKWLLWGICVSKELFLQGRQKSPLCGKGIQAKLLLLNITWLKVQPNSLPNCKILDWSTLKAFVDNKIQLAKVIIFVFDRVEYIVGIGKILSISILSFSHNVFERFFTHGY